MKYLTFFFGDDLNVLKFAIRILFYMTFETTTIYAQKRTKSIFEEIRCQDKIIYKQISHQILLTEMRCK